MALPVERLIAGRWAASTLWGIRLFHAGDYGLRPEPKAQPRLGGETPGPRGVVQAGETPEAICQRFGITRKTFDRMADETSNA